MSEPRNGKNLTGELYVFSAGKVCPVTALDTALEWKVAVIAQKHERPELWLRPFRGCSAIYLWLLPLDIELFRMQRRIALDQDVLAGQFFEFHEPRSVIRLEHLYRLRIHT